MTKFDELKAKYPNLIPAQELRANVSIMELAVQYGYEQQIQKGRTRPVLHHAGFKDTIIIKNPQDPSQQVYQSTGDFRDAGTVIDFVRNRLGSVFSRFNQPGKHEFANITGVLYDYLRIEPIQAALNRQAFAKAAEPATPKTFAKELFDIRPLGENSYLNKRNLAPRVINSPEFAGKAVTQIAYLNPTTGHTDDFLTAKANPDVKYITFKSVAFPYYNGRSADVMGFELRNDRINLHAPGSDRYSSVFLSNPPQKTSYFVITESVLDAMAHKQLRSMKDDDAFDTLYFSTGGQLTPEQVNTITRYMASLDKIEDWKINLSFDNDLKGHRFDLMFVQQLTAQNFPISPTVAGLGRLGYILPEGEAYTVSRDSLIQQVENYNLSVRTQAEHTADLTNKELAGQLITISQKDQQTSLQIPETAGAMHLVTQALIQLTGLNQRIEINKASGKDFCDDLKQHIEQGQKFKYSVTDETGERLYSSNSAVTAQRTLIHLQKQFTAESDDKSFKILLRQPDGWPRLQAELVIRDGKVIQASQQPEFKRQVLEEKSSRSTKVSQSPEQINTDKTKLK